MTESEGVGFGRLLKQHRTAARLTQEDLAQATGLSIRGISALETGERSRPHRDSVELLADALHLSDAALTSFRAAAREAGRFDRGEAGPQCQDGDGLAPALTVQRTKHGRRVRTVTMVDFRLALGLATLAILMGALILLGVSPGRSVVAGSGTHERSVSRLVSFVRPMGVAIDSSGDAYVSDQRCDALQTYCPPGALERIVRISPVGAVTVSWDKPYVLVDPAGLALDRHRNLYVAEPMANQVAKVSPDGRLLAQWGSQGAGRSQLEEPMQLAVNRGNDNIYVADTGNHRIKELMPWGRVVRIWGSQGHGPGQFEYPSGLAIDAAGNVYVADTGNNRIQKFSPAGKFISQFGGNRSGAVPLRGPRALAVATGGDIYVADTGNNRIQRFSAGGKLLASWGRFGLGLGRFNDPVALAVATGGNLYVADAGNARIQEFTSSGRYLRQWGRRVPDVRLCVEAPDRIPGMGSVSRGTFNAVSMATAKWRPRLAAAGLNLQAPIRLDEAFEPGQAARNARACVARRDTFGFIGPISSRDALVEEPILNRAGMPTVSPLNTMELLTDPKYRFRLEPATYARKVRSITYFRMVSPDQSQGAGAAQFMRQTLKLRTYYSVDDGSPYGRSVLNALIRYSRARLALRSLGASQLAPEDPARMQSTIQAATRAVQVRNPDGVYCACDVSVATQFARSLRLKGYAKPLVLDDAAFEGSSAWTPFRALRMVYATAVDLSPESMTTGSFSRSYRALFHIKADPAALPAYEAADVALAALYTASKEDHHLPTVKSMRTRILPHLARVRYRQMQEHIAFDRNGDLQPRSVTVFALSAGQWHFLSTVHP